MTPQEQTWARIQELRTKAVDAWWDMQVMSEIFDEIKEDIEEYLSEEDYAEYEKLIK